MEFIFPKHILKNIYCLDSPYLKSCGGALSIFSHQTQFSNHQRRFSSLENWLLNWSFLLYQIESLPKTFRSRKWVIEVVLKEVWVIVFLHEIISSKLVARWRWLIRTIAPTWNLNLLNQFCSTQVILYSWVIVNDLTIGW